MARAVDELRAQRSGLGPDDGRCTWSARSGRRSSHTPAVWRRRRPDRSASRRSPTRSPNAVTAARAVLDRLRWQPSGRGAQCRSHRAGRRRSLTDRRAARARAAPAGRLGNGDHSRARWPGCCAGQAFHRRARTDRAAAGGRAARRTRTATDRAAAGAVFELLADLDLVVQTPRGRTAPAAADRRAGRPGRAGAGPAAGHTARSTRSSCSSARAAAGLVAAEGASALLADRRVRPAGRAGPRRSAGGRSPRRGRTRTGCSPARASPVPMPSDPRPTSRASPCCAAPCCTSSPTQDPVRRRTGTRSRPRLPGTARGCGNRRSTRSGW